MTETKPVVQAERRYERYEIFSRAHWDFFSAGHGSKSGLITNISRGGCLFRTNELIEHRRWVRFLTGARGNVHLSLVGRIIRCENIIETFGTGEVTLFRYGVEFANTLTEEPAELFAPLPSNVTVLQQPHRTAEQQLIKRSQ